MCDRIEISERTGTGPDLNHFGRIGWIFTVFLTFTLNLQVTNMNMAASILRYKLKVRTRRDIFRLVLSSCAQFRPCEATEPKRGQKLKSTHKEIKL